MDHSENQTSNPRIKSGAITIGQVIEARLSRRNFLAGLGATAAIANTGCATNHGTVDNTPTPGTFTFPEITRGGDGNHHVPDGYETDIILRWGDAVFPDSPVFDPHAQTVKTQERQFGYNNDFIGYYPPVSYTHLTLPTTPYV